MSKLRRQLSVGTSNIVRNKKPRMT